MNVGVVGTGHLGSTLIEGLYSRDHRDLRVFGFNRTQKKIEKLRKRYPQLINCKDVETAVRSSRVLVLAAPFSFIETLTPSVINMVRQQQPIILALCGYVPIELLERLLPAKVAKGYPNINWAVREGVTLVHFGKRFKPKEKKPVVQLLRRVGNVYEVSEDQFRPYGNIMSCGPALWMRLIEAFVTANTTAYPIDPKLALEMAEKTIGGTFRLMKEKRLEVGAVVENVAGRGGVTEVGLRCLEKSMPKIFAETVKQIAVRDGQRIHRLEGKTPA